MLNNFIGWIKRNIDGLSIALTLFLLVILVFYGNYDNFKANGLFRGSVLDNEN